MPAQRTFKSHFGMCRYWKEYSVSTIAVAKCLNAKIILNLY